MECAFYTLFRVHTTWDDEKSPWIKYIIVGLLQLNFGNEDRPKDLRNLDPLWAEGGFLEPAAYTHSFFISWYYQQTGNINNSNTWLRSKGIEFLLHVISTSAVVVVNKKILFHMISVFLEHSQLWQLNCAPSGTTLDPLPLSVSLRLRRSRKIASLSSFLSAKTWMNQSSNNSNIPISKKRRQKRHLSVSTISLQQ